MDWGIVLAAARCVVSLSLQYTSGSGGMYRNSVRGDAHLCRPLASRPQSAPERSRGTATVPPALLHSSRQTQRSHPSPSRTPQSQTYNTEQSHVGPQPYKPKRQVIEEAGPPLTALSLILKAHIVCSTDIRHHRAVETTGPPEGHCGGDHGTPRGRVAMETTGPPESVLRWRPRDPQRACCDGDHRTPRRACCSGDHRTPRKACCGGDCRTPRRACCSGDHRTPRRACCSGDHRTPRKTCCGGDHGTPRKRMAMETTGPPEGRVAVETTGPPEGRVAVDCRTPRRACCGGHGPSGVSGLAVRRDPGGRRPGERLLQSLTGQAVGEVLHKQDPRLLAACNTHHHQHSPCRCSTAVLTTRNVVSLYKMHQQAYSYKPVQCRQFEYCNCSHVYLLLTAALCPHPRGACPCPCPRGHRPGHQRGSGRSPGRTTQSSAYQSSQTPAPLPLRTPQTQSCNTNRNHLSAQSFRAST